jgi:hypothetical protein
MDVLLSVRRKNHWRVDVWMEGVLDELPGCCRDAKRPFLFFCRRKRGRREGVTIGRSGLPGLSVSPRSERSSRVGLLYVLMDSQITDGFGSLPMLGCQLARGN